MARKGYGPPPGKANMGLALIGEGSERGENTEPSPCFQAGAEGERMGAGRPPARLLHRRDLSALGVQPGSFARRPPGLPR